MVFNWTKVDAGASDIKTLSLLKSARITPGAELPQIVINFYCI